MNNNELAHYGVLGMKWGMRKAKNSGGSYAYKSHATKKYTRKAEKAKTQADRQKYENRAKRSAEMDAKEQKIAERTSTGKLIAANIFTGGTASLLMKNYQQFSAMGNSKTKAMLKSFAFAGLPVRQLQKASYIRQDEKKGS